MCKLVLSGKVSSIGNCLSVPLSPPGLRSLEEILPLANPRGLNGSFKVSVKKLSKPVPPGSLRYAGPFIGLIKCVPVPFTATCASMVAVAPTLPATVSTILLPTFFNVCLKLAPFKL